MKILITGGAGFIGSNAARYFNDIGWEVFIFDNLSRMGTNKNLEWINTFCRPNFILGDVRNFDQIANVIDNNNIDVVLHLAGQVAVTSSINNPRDDFNINALGTFNVCEAVKRCSNPPILIFSSTNKVYGKLDYLQLREKINRYELVDSQGIDELAPLQFYSPYGCSKGAADQYVLDYSRNYGVKTVVFRQSCIYGTRQMGIEDQGWVAWFIIAAALGREISIYGNGKQVRDLLFIDDLVFAYHAAIKSIDKCNGEVFNIGGGKSNSLSLLELLGILKVRYPKLHYKFERQRPGDQEIFICNIEKIRQSLQWQPVVSVDQGLNLLINWVEENLEIFKHGL